MTSHLRKILPISLILFFVFIIWFFFIRSTFTRVILPSNIDKFTISSTYSGDEIAKGTDDTTIYIKRGTYFVRTFSGDKISSVSIWDSNLLPFKTLSVDEAPTQNTKKVSPIIGDSADDVVALNSGEFIYINKHTKAVNIASSDGINDISNSFKLTTNEGNIYNRAVALLQYKSGAILVTTKEVYNIKSSQNIELIEPYRQDFSPNYYEASLDNKTNMLFLLNSYDSTIYAHNLDMPYSGITDFKKIDMQIQNINAGGGKLAIFADNIPSLSKNAVQKYSERIIVTPTIIDIKSKEKTDLPKFKASNFVLPAEKGPYIVIKEKYSTTIKIYNTDTEESVTLPGFDVSGVVWVESKLYLARDSAIWLYDATSSNNNLIKIADTIKGVTNINHTDNQLVISSLSNIAQVISLTENGPPLDDLAKNIQLQSKDYYAIFSNVNNNLWINIQSLPSMKSITTSVTENIKKLSPANNVTVTSGHVLLDGVYKYATPESISE